MNITNIRLSVLIVSILSIGPSFGQEAGEGELAKASQNPVGDLISLPFQNNTNFDVGPGRDVQNILNIQPVWPIALNTDWNLITRTIIPVVSQPEFVPDDGRTTGLGDTVFTAFLSPRKAGKLIWGAGPAFLLPTGTDDLLGADKWGLGLSAVFLTMRGPWVVGSLFSNLWSVAGSGAADVNLFTWQYFVNYNLPGGTYLTSAPVINANWKADGGNRWTVPFGGGVGKIFRVGRQPMNGQISAYYNAEKPKFAANWQLRLQLQLLFPKR